MIFVPASQVHVYCLLCLVIVKVLQAFVSSSTQDTNQERFLSAAPPFGVVAGRIAEILGGHNHLPSGQIIPLTCKPWKSSLNPKQNKHFVFNNIIVIISLITPDRPALSTVWGCGVTEAGFVAGLGASDHLD